MAYSPLTWVNQVTDVGPTNLNHMEQGIATADANATTAIANAATAQTTANAAVPKSTVTTAGDLIYATGNAAVTRLALGATGTVMKGGASAPSFAQIVDADVSASAAIAASKISGLPVLYSWAFIRHSVTSGTDGGTLTASTWLTRPCAEVTDADGILSVASNQLTLAAGTYRVRITATGYSMGGRVGTRLRNVTDGTTLLVGSQGYAVDSQWTAEVAGQFTVAAAKALEIQHWTGVTQSANGMGAAVASGEVEVYMVGEIWKVA